MVEQVVLARAGKRGGQDDKEGEAEASTCWAVDGDNKMSLVGEGEVHLLRSYGEVTSNGLHVRTQGDAITL